MSKTHCTSGTSKVKVSKHDIIKITLPANFSTGHCWRFNLEGRGYNLLRSHYIADNTETVGGGGTVEYEVQVIDNGKLILDYKRPWESVVDKIVVVDFQIEE